MLLLEPPPGQRGANGGESALSREGGGVEGGGQASGSAWQLRRSMGDKQDGASYGCCWAIVARGQRVVGLPYGPRPVMQSGEVSRRHRFTAALEVVKPILGDGKHSRWKSRPTPGCALQQWDSRGYPTMARTDGFMGSATAGTEVRLG